MIFHNQKREICHTLFLSILLYSRRFNFQCTDSLAIPIIRQNKTQNHTQFENTNNNAVLHSYAVGGDRRAGVGGARRFPPSGAEHSSEPPRGGGGAEGSRQSPPRPNVERHSRLSSSRNLRSKLRWVRVIH